MVRGLELVATRNVARAVSSGSEAWTRHFAGYPWGTAYLDKWAKLSQREKFLTISFSQLAAVPQVKNYGKKFNCLRLRRRPYYFFTLPIEKKEIARDFSHRDNFTRLSKYAVPQEYPAKCRVQASDPEGSTLVTFRVATSSNPRTMSQIEWRWRMRSVQDWSGPQYMY